MKYLETWDEFRIAYEVAKLGTLSAAANSLGIHHATVIRNIDALEGRLGTKLFQRNPRGYAPTEAGLELLKVAAVAEEMLERLSGRLRGQSDAVRGKLIVTSISVLAENLTEALVAFGRRNPDVKLELVLDDRALRLESGEAHVALRVGPKPIEPDMVVQKICEVPGNLFAHKQYVETYGVLGGDQDAANHRFVGRTMRNTHFLFQDWMDKYVPEECIVYRASNPRCYEDAIRKGAGIGFMSSWTSGWHADLIEMKPTSAKQKVALWIVKHMDLHRSAKVQALTGFLKQHLALALVAPPT